MSCTWRYFITDLDNGDIYTVSQKLADRFIRFTDVTTFPAFANRRIGLGIAQFRTDENGILKLVVDISGNKVALTDTGAMNEKEWISNLGAVMDLVGQIRKEQEPDFTIVCKTKSASPQSCGRIMFARYWRILLKNSLLQALRTHNSIL